MSENSDYSIDDILYGAGESAGGVDENGIASILSGASQEKDAFSVEVEDEDSYSVFSEIEKATADETEQTEKATEKTVDIKAGESGDKVADVNLHFEEKEESDENAGDSFSFDKINEERKRKKERDSKTKVFGKGARITEKQEVEEPSEFDESEEEIEKEFKEKRREKIKRFKIVTENLGRDSYDDDNEENVTVSQIIDYNEGDDLFKIIEKTDKPKKESTKRREKRKMRDSKVYDKIDVGRVKIRLEEEERDIKIRLTVTAVCFVLCLILGAAKTLYVSGKADFLGGFMGTNPIIVYALELVFGLFPLILAFKAMINRMRNNEKPTLCSEAMAFVIFTVNTLHNVVLIIQRPEVGKDSMLFGTAACFAALLGIVGEKKENLMIKKNLAAITRNETIMGVFALESDNEKLACGISKTKEPMILCAGEVEIPDSFLDSSMTKDKENTFFNIAVPVSIALSAVCGVIAYLSYGGLTAFSSAMLSALLVSSPVFLSPVLISLIARTNESLNRTGCEILGYEDVENIDDTDAIVLDTADIFNGNISHFHLVSRAAKIDTLHAFEISCSILYSSGGVLRNEIEGFMKEQKLILPKVEELKYEEKLGLSCWVEDKCALLGTYKMMKEHNIRIPPEYAGEKYEKEGSNVLYLAFDTHATAMFCVDYFIGRHAKKQLVDLYKTGAILMLMTTDPHIDEQFVAATLGVSDSSIKTVSPVGAARIRDSVERTTKQKRTGLIFKNSIVGLLKVINAAFRLYDAQSLTMLIQIVSMVFAAVVSGVLSAVATGYLPGALFIIAYHLIWTCLSYTVTAKNKK